MVASGAGTPTCTNVPFVLTHLGPDVDASGITDVTVAEDFEMLSL